MLSWRSTKNEPSVIWLIVFSQSVGNLAFQDFHQRTLSSSSTSTARMICFIAAGVVLVLGTPPVLIGAVAASTGIQAAGWCAEYVFDKCDNC